MLLCIHIEFEIIKLLKLMIIENWKRLFLPEKAHFLPFQRFLETFWYRTATNHSDCKFVILSSELDNILLLLWQYVLYLVFIVLLLWLLVDYVLFQKVQCCFKCTKFAQYLWVSLSLAYQGNFSLTLIFVKTIAPILPNQFYYPESKEITIHFSHYIMLYGL